ncbi:hypothetical protein Q3G72_006375 [Acer saccharum]|nr:hypothetical protein Q3G72_006375 [Acer saccharum]
MKSNELAMIYSTLSIKEKERPVGTLDSNLKEKGEHLLSLCLVVKVLINKLVNKEALINVLSTIWRTNEGVEIEALEGNLFACYFKNMDDRKYIQSGGTWTFDRAIIAFKEPSGTGNIAHMKFNRVEFWVQIHKLPLLCLTKDIGTFLGKMIGEIDNERGDENGLVQEEVQCRVVRPELVTSSEVSSVGDEAPSHFQSVGRSLPARRVQ